ncbi:MAG: hypothetical protein QM655_00435 [Nocardioidaceae bacterium]
MTPQIITYVLTALAALAVVLTRLRLGGTSREAAGRLSIPRGLLNVHTLAGVLGLVAWGGYLATGQKRLAVVGLVLLWIVVVVGLMILLRWMPVGGRHSSGPVADSWGKGPGLSILAHVGMLAGVAVFTVFFLLDKLS